MSFKTGDKVVCIFDGDMPWSHEFNYPNGRPKLGTVYVVESFHPHGSMLEGRLIYGFRCGAVRIVGKPLFHTETNTLWCYIADQFRLVSEVGHPPVSVAETISTL